jgi:phosphoribosylanthranilate isomerase
VRRIKVKICGIMTPEAGVAAAEAGADAVGLVFAPYRRQVSPAQAREIALSLPPLITTVGLFVDAPAEHIESLARTLCLGAVQLHGQEPPEMCEHLRQQGLRVIKALHVGDRLDRDLLERYRSASALLLDTRVEGLPGGTGRTFPWQVAAGLSTDFRLIVAGGLTPDNVWGALDILHPYGVDVTSGVETDGRKDPAKIRAFIDQVRRWEQAGRFNPA